MNYPYRGGKAAPRSGPVLAPCLAENRPVDGKATAS